MNLDDYKGLPYSLRPVPGCVNCWSIIAMIYMHELNIEIKGFSANLMSDVSSVFSAAFASGEHGFYLVEEPINYDVVIFIKGRPGKEKYHAGMWYDGMVLHASYEWGQVVYHQLSVAKRGFERIEFWRLSDFTKKTH